MAHLTAQLKKLSPKTIAVITAGSAAIIGGVIVVAIVALNSSQRENVNESATRQEEVLETETISFKTIEKEDKNKDEGTSEIQQEGNDGEKTTKYLITYDSEGNEVTREKVSEDITLESVDRIVIKGTRKLNPIPPQQSTKPNNTPVTTAPAKDPCKTELVGWGRPANCPYKQTREEYSALGGWEKLIWSFYSSNKDMEPMKRCDGETCVYERGGTISGLCYGTATIDLDTLTVLSVEWDDSPTSTCDAVRDEHPPLPSTEHLTSYLRSIANE